jgi:hypothetical protein
LPRQLTPYALQFTDVGGGIPFELAREFKIWQGLTVDQRRDIEKVPTAHRRDRLLEYGRDVKFRDFRPSDFRLEDWVPKVDAKIDELSTSVPTFKAALAKAATKPAARSQLNRRLAINLYYLEQPPQPDDPERLNQFLAVVPPWIRSTFDAYPIDEARRRATIIYRLAYPYPEEFKPARTQSQVPSTAARLETRQAPPQQPPSPASIPKQESAVPRPPSSQPF